MTSAVPPAPPSQPPADAWQPPPPGPPARPALRRSRTDKVLGGVAGGLAEYTGIDALLWRVGLVALTFAGGTGILVYLLLWVLMPAGPLVPGAPGRGRRAPAGPRSPVPRLTMAALLIVLGLLVLLTRLTGWDLAPAAFFGTALLIVGLGLVAAAFSPGRTARGGLIALGVVLSFGLLVSTSEPWEHGDGGFGDRTIDPRSAAAVRPVYDAGVGDVTLDLTRFDLSGLDEPVTTRLDAGVGDVEILVPRSADVRVEVDSGIGDVDVLGGGSDSGYFRGQGSAPWAGDDDPEIVLTINAGIGDVEVSRA
jgi:phage shock protein PspC (stress-responsive transcriptional regulator)